VFFEFKQGENIMVDYSTEEQAIARKWHDGRTIYMKTLVRIGNESTGNTTFAHGIENLDRVVKWEANALRSDGGSIPLPYATQVYTWAIAIQHVGDNIALKIGTAWVNPVVKDLTVTVFYVKTEA
jgi:hypothetical protein